MDKSITSKTTQSITSLRYISHCTIAILFIRHHSICRRRRFTAAMVNKSTRAIPRLDTTLDLTRPMALMLSIILKKQ